MARCSCLTKHNKICRLSSIFNINSNRYCSIHAKLLFNYHTILIQKNYRRFRVRKKVDTIIKRVPDDVRDIILFYMREELYNKRYNESIEKIIINKTVRLLGPLGINTAEQLLDFLIANSGINIDNRKFYHLNYYKEISNLYILYYKYYTILDNEYLKKLYNLGRVLTYIFETAVLTGQVRNDNNEILIIDTSEYLKFTYEFYSNICKWNSKMKELLYLDIYG
tara:strand:+ start:1244 stop:1912 length:669 start_codon:yes stop_codon:yes gene_type:complete